jgi:serine/threonine protein kinase
VSSLPKHQLAAGTVIAQKWQIERLLGSGGMGSVYSAKHVRNAREVAIKILHPVVSADPAAVERFLHEGYAANKVGHNGTVQVLDDGQDGQVASTLR